MKKPKDIHGYIKSFPKEVQRILNEIHSVIKKTAPKAEETISYGIPAFKLNGKDVVYFAGYRNHVSIYPAPRESAEFKKELAAYKGGKGTIQFPLLNPIPFELIARIVKYKVKNC